MLNKLKESLEIQSRAIQALADNLDANLEPLVDQIMKTTGRVVLCGLGKSGHIAKKVAATMSSTGTPAFFLHPSESLHGDLGMVRSDDFVIFISKSGENPELNLMLPTLNRLSVTMAILTSNPDSSLASNVGIVINLGDVEEICPLALAPTTSSTLTMVLLDAIAMEAMRRKNFNAEDYALFHPSGQLGRRLMYQVKDLMSPFSKLPFIFLEAKPKELLHIMTEKMMGVALVVDHQNKLLGLITDNDVRRSLEKNDDFFQINIAEIMNANPSTCSENDKAYDVLLTMRRRQKPITLMPVVDNDGIVKGLLRLETMVQHGLA